MAERRPQRVLARVRPRYICSVERSGSRLIVQGPRARIRRVGERIGAAAQPGDVIALVGDLGAGKTFLAQAIARGAGVSPEVRIASPTFTIVQSYPARIPVFHADLYRLGSERDLDEIGLFAQAASGLAVVEWAERFAEEVPASALWIEIERSAPLARRLWGWGEGEAAERLMAAAERAAMEEPTRPRAFRGDRA